MNTQSTARTRVRHSTLKARAPRRQAKVSAAPAGASTRLIALLLVGGALSGAAMIALSPKIWSRIGAGLFGAGAWLARFSLPPAVLGAVLARGTGSGTRHLPRNADINVIAG